MDLKKIRDSAKTIRMSEKDNIVYKNIIAAFIVKGFALILSLYMMPAYMRFFEDEGTLGVWFTILSVLTWILSFDLGIGNGLRNKLSESVARKNDSATRGYISSAYWVIGIISLVTCAIGLFAIPFCDWNSVFNISGEIIHADSLVYAVRCAFVGVLLNFFLRLVSSIIYAMQKSSINNLLSLLTSLLQFVFLWIAPNGTAEQNLRMFSTAYIFTSNIPLVIATLVIFSGKLKTCKPCFKCIDKEKTKSILSLGGLFFLCQILYMIIANTNEFFITRYTGPENVVEYQIYNKLFSLGSMVFSLALTPIWSIVSKAIAENDMQWLRKLYRKLEKLSMIGIACEFAMIIVLQMAINIWLGEKAIRVDYIYAFAFALFGSCMLYQSMLSTITNGMGKMRIQATCYAVGVAAKFLIIPLGIAWTGSWIIVVIVNAVILLPYCIFQKLALDRTLKSDDDSKQKG